MCAKSNCRDIVIGAPSWNSKIETGVISPYKGQVHLIKDLLADLEKRMVLGEVNVKTVDGFQGR